MQVEIASEFRYRDSIFLPGDAVLTISQSGETADTLAAIRIAREAGTPILGLCNVVGSSIARESDRVVYTQAGPEISVASTKAMCSQMVLLLLMALFWGDRKKTLPEDVRERCLEALTRLPDILETQLPGLRDRAGKLSQEYADARSFFFLTPRSPATVEKRANSSVFLPISEKIFALVYLVMSCVTVKVPYAPEPLACMRRSGMTSRSKWASFSRNQTSCRSCGPRGPAVIR